MSLKIDEKFYLIRWARSLEVFIIAFFFIAIVMFVPTFSSAAKGSYGNGYASAQTPDGVAWISLSGYLRPEPDNKFGLNYYIYCQTNYQGQTVFQYAIGGYTASYDPSKSSFTGNWNGYFDGHWIYAYGPGSATFHYKTTNSQQFISKSALPLRIMVNVYISQSDTDTDFGYMNYTSFGGGASCVYALTPILLANNSYQFAENINIGDSIKSYNLTTHTLENSTVMNVSITNWSKMYIINGYLMVAPDQNIWTNKGYVEAQNLTLNDTMFDIYYGGWDAVTSIIVITGNFTMFDFTMSVNGNYIAWWNVIKDLAGPPHYC